MAKFRGPRNRLPEKRCPATNKVCWPELGSAQKEAKFIRKEVGAKVSAYYCTYCRHFHIGHNRPVHRRGPRPPLA